MPGRNLHNLFNAMLFGFSGNDLHAFMDRAAKSLRQKHRDVGHDINGLMQMLILYAGKYKPMDIMKTWLMHKMLDGAFTGIQEGVKNKNKGYGKKDNMVKIIEKLKKEALRL